MAYEVYNYGANGAYEPEDVTEVETLREARRSVRSRLGDLAAWRRWRGTDTDVEAYHDSRDDGCGGVAIRPVK